MGTSRPKKYTEQEILNRVFDAANNRLNFTGATVTTDSSSRLKAYTEQEILNRVFIANTNELRIKI